MTQLDSNLASLADGLLQRKRFLPPPRLTILNSQSKLRLIRWIDFQGGMSYLEFRRGILSSFGNVISNQSKLSIYSL